MRKFLILLMLLAGCASNPIPPQGGIPVSIMWHKTTLPLLIREGNRYHTLNGRFQMINGVCHVWAPDPPVANRAYTMGQWGTLGHEIKHCFDGLFHD